MKERQRRLKQKTVHERGKPVSGNYRTNKHWTSQYQFQILDKSITSIARFDGSGKVFYPNQQKKDFGLVPHKLVTQQRTVASRFCFDCLKTINYLSFYSTQRCDVCAHNFLDLSNSTKTFSGYVMNCLNGIGWCGQYRPFIVYLYEKPVTQGWVNCGMMLEFLAMEFNGGMG